ncbi:MAG: biotin--[Clostridia bacterium]|nr:biotin--[acetyl-CoA-carboxylase] ligase [Clostridia bacterium]
MLSAEKIKNLISPAYADAEVYVYDCVDSTNTRAKEDKTMSLGIICARAQTAGRGRLGRSFHSPDGDGIYMSFLIYPDGSAQDATAMTAYAAVKACRAISRFTDAEVRIKWVNDLILGGRKLAGILTEGE